MADTRTNHSEERRVEPKNTPLILIIRDGWGCNPNTEHDDFNAVKLAETPVEDRMLREYPHTLIRTAGLDVGVPDGTAGNSEVGHQNIGAGRIVDQDSARVTKAIRDGDFFENEVLCRAVDRAKARGETEAPGGRVHLLGIASDAGVHGLLDHLYACMELCKKRGMAGDRVCLHLFTDGRDTGPFTGIDFLQEVEARIRDLGVGRIASVVGRYWAMDRDYRWERVARAYRAMTLQGDGGETEEGRNPPTFQSATEAVQAYYDRPHSKSMTGDEFVVPSMIGESEEAVRATRIGPEDVVIFVNYRGDRPRELVRALVMPEFENHVHPSPDSDKRGFDRGDRLNVHMVTMCAYDSELNQWVEVAYPKPDPLRDIAGEYLSRLGLRQFRCAETEKYPHVTFFFNDYREEPFEGERRQIIQSPRVATYDMQPEMSAFFVADAVVERLLDQNCEDVLVVNFANPDMVGHTGNLDAAVRAVETVDACVGKIGEAVLRRYGSMIVTADHGNAEQMWNPESDAPHTSHTLYDVEAFIIGRAFRDRSLRETGRLADLMPTALDMMGLDKPEAMTGESLLL